MKVIKKSVRRMIASASWQIQFGIAGKNVAEPISASTPQMNLVKCRRVCMAKDNGGR